MASTLKINTLTGVTTAGSIAVTGEGNSTTTNLQQGLAKSWVNHNKGASINDSLNVASLTDNGTGQHRHTLTNLHANVSYAVSGSTIGDGSTQSQAYTYTYIGGGDNAANSVHSTSVVYYNIIHHAGSLYDTEMVQVITHGDLA